MARHHHGVKREHLPYCPTLGPHHMNWEDRHFRTTAEKRLRNFGEFIMPLTLAPPPNHTLIHRSLAEPPKPTYNEIQTILGVAQEGGLYAVINQVDNRTTDHYRKQLFIAAIPTDEAIGRLIQKSYVTEKEMRGF